ncbi:MAG: hypothetical protein HPY50_04250 [Firmicutes bacterium]|nr:hypothetical protein [Bacillota bacterium]
MHTILLSRNYSLLNQILDLKSVIKAATILPELEHYRSSIYNACITLCGVVERNIKDLSLGNDSIIEDILSNTHQATYYIRLIGSRLTSPILRASENDRLSLLTIKWLHQQSPKTVIFPPAFHDGSTAIWPFIQFAPVYYLSFFDQKGLLFQPLLFHEYGHLLYACHRDEMNDLVGELQTKIDNNLLPNSQRNDRYANNQAKIRQQIVNTWYSWIQELFCDAIGLLIGGPCFIHAISSRLSTMNPSDFYQQSSYMMNSSHPITWLRIQLIAARAMPLGYQDTAELLLQEWNLIKKSMGITEDYHGFYDVKLENDITRIINDMITEAEPRLCTQTEALGNNWNPALDSLICLFNRAWRVYHESPSTYPIWEKEAIKQILAIN